MNRFVVCVFPDETSAYKGLHALWELHREGTVTVFGTSVVARETNGTLTVKQRTDEGPLGLGIGAITGSLVGVFGGPIGVAVGAVAGGMIGSVGDVFEGELGNDFVEDVKHDLTPGKFAVIAEVAEDWLVPLEASVEDLGGTVIRESKAAYVDTLVERTVEARKGELEQWKAERASEFAKWKADRAGDVASFKADVSSKVADKMEAALDAKVERARTKLLRTAETARGYLDRTKEEMQAKILTLEEQAARATPDVRERIRHRIAEVEKDLGDREQKLARAYELTQEALHP